MKSLRHQQWLRGVFLFLFIYATRVRGYDIHRGSKRCQFIFTINLVNVKVNFSNFVRCWTQKWTAKGIKQNRPQYSFTYILRHRPEKFYSPTMHLFGKAIQTSCARGDTICPRPSPPRVGAVAPRTAEPTAAPADGNVAAVYHAQYVPTLTAAAACA